MEHPYKIEIKQDESTIRINLGGTTTYDLLIGVEEINSHGSTEFRSVGALLTNVTCNDLVLISVVLNYYLHTQKSTSTTQYTQIQAHFKLRILVKNM